MGRIEYETPIKYVLSPWPLYDFHIRSRLSLTGFSPRRTHPMNSARSFNSAMLCLSR
jgi:hypothetical protein